MKHPHCNRSLAAHLFWCRGFAPVFFIVVVALFVVSVGSGFYFASRPDAALAPAEPVAVAEQKIEEVAQSPESKTVATEPVVVKPVAVVATPVAKPATAPVVAPKPVQPKVTDCDVESDDSVTCLFVHVIDCMPVKATAVNDGMRVEYVVEGLVNGKCIYRATMTPLGEYLSEALNMRCVIPEEQLLPVLMETDNTLTLRFCTGSYIDILRQARGMEPTAQ